MAVLKGYIKAYEEVNEVLPKDVFKRFAWEINTQMEYLREDLKVDEYLSTATQIFDEKPSEMKYYNVDVSLLNNPEGKEIEAVMVVTVVGNIKRDFPRRFLDGMPVLNYKGYYNSFWNVSKNYKHFVCAIYKEN